MFCTAWRPIRIFRAVCACLVSLCVVDIGFDWFTKHGVVCYPSTPRGHHTHTPTPRLDLLPVRCLMHVYLDEILVCLSCTFYLFLLLWSEGRAPLSQARRWAKSE